MTRVGRKDNHAKSASARALRGGRPVSNGAKRARAARYGGRTPWSRGSAPAAVGLARCRCGGALSNGVGWSTSRVGREDNHAKSASARVLRGWSVGPPRGEARMGRAARDSEAVVTRFRSRSRPPGTVSVRKSLGQRGRVETVARWPRRQPRQVRQRASAPWPDGRFSTARRAHGPCGTKLVRSGHEAPKPQPSAWRGVGAKEPWPIITWDGTRRSLAATTATPSPPAHVCSVAGRSVLHGAKRARAVRHGARSCEHETPKPQPSAWHGVGAE